MPKKRNKENQGLPKRWRYTRNAYYYQVPPGLEHLWEGKKTFKLGNTLTEAYKEWAKRLETNENVKTVGELLDRYALEVIPTKALSTQKENNRQITLLRKIFGMLPLSAIEPQHIYKFYDKRDATTSAKREIALFSHAFTKAVEWGYIKQHPFKGQVRIENNKPRDRYIEDWEIIECLSLKSRQGAGSVTVIQEYIRLKLLTGLRKGDMLRLKKDDLKKDGIHVKTGKTGKTIIYEWSNELHQAIEKALNSRPIDISPFIFCNRLGRSYINEAGESFGFDSMWQRFMKRLLNETLVKERFTEHDLRAKVASDATNLEHARALLAHSDSKITTKHYRRKAEKVLPMSYLNKTESDNK
ncbi:MAG: tyrosine-type recombinase/integrase [Pseudomonadota bacterium]